MANIEFLQINKESFQTIESAKMLWIPYVLETKKNKNEEIVLDQINDNLVRRINIQGLRDSMHFELFYFNSECIGIANFAIDLGGIRGIIEPGYGFIMEFYIVPEKRKHGFGRMFFSHIESVLKADGANALYLTPDLVTGIPFWKALGFENSKKIDPDNHMPIFIKKI
ncbi:MAG: GNAT family N-acetyltransferase [Firmicutes bacterium]|nr:GNAT family N-acetyltransferase [Bacillota bacterium]